DASRRHQAVRPKYVVRRLGAYRGVEGVARGDDHGEHVWSRGVLSVGLGHGSPDPAEPAVLGRDEPCAIVLPPLSFHLRCSNRARRTRPGSVADFEEREPLVATVLEEAFVPGGA